MSGWEGKRHSPSVYRRVSINGRLLLEAEEDQTAKS